MHIAHTHTPTNKENRRNEEGQKNPIDKQTYINVYVYNRIYKLIDSMWISFICENVQSLKL